MKFDQRARSKSRQISLCGVTIHGQFAMTTLPFGLKIDWETFRVRNEYGSIGRIFKADEEVAYDLQRARCNTLC